jgi:hypothetical protein
MKTDTMSAFGTKRTFLIASGMSAFGGKADIRLSAIVGDASRKRKKPDMIAGPTWTLDGCAFRTAAGATGAGTQFVA